MPIMQAELNLKIDRTHAIIISFYLHSFLDSTNYRIYITGYTSYKANSTSYKTN